MHCLTLTLILALARHLQVHGGQAQLVGLLRGQVFGRRLLLLHGVADAEAAPHGGHLSIELLPGDLVVEAQPAELDLHPEGTCAKKRRWCEVRVSGRNVGSRKTRTRGEKGNKKPKKKAGTGNRKKQNPGN